MSEVERAIVYVTALLSIIGIGIAIGVFQERAADQGKAIDKLLLAVASLDVMETKLNLIDKRLNRIEYGQNDLVVRYNSSANKKRGDSPKWDI